MSRRDYLGDDGKFKPALLADAILKETKFITIRETGAILWYDDRQGFWQPDGDTIIEQKTKEDLGEEYSGRNKSEVLANITALTYVNRIILNSYEGLINLKNGIYSIKEKKLLEHDPDYYFTSVLPYDYKPDAIPEKILEFLWSVAQPDWSLLFSLLEHIAWTLMKNNRFQKLALLYGEGSNGKGTYLRLIKMFLGPKNCSSANIYQLTTLRFHVAGLDGKKANLAGDIEYNRPLSDTAILKQLRGEDMMSGEFKNSQPFDFVFEGKCFFSANKFPKTTDTTYAFNRTWSIIQFANQFKAENGTIKQDIISEICTDAELSGMFNVALEFLEILESRSGFTFAPTPEEVGELYKEKSNSAQVFIDKCLKYNPEVRMFKDEIRSFYEEFCTKSRLIVETEKAFTQTLSASVLSKCPVRQELGKRFYQGIEYCPPEDIQNTKNKEFPKEFEKFCDYYASLQTFRPTLTTLAGFSRSSAKQNERLEKGKENIVNPVKPVFNIPEPDQDYVRISQDILKDISAAENGVILQTSEGMWGWLYKAPAFAHISRQDIDKVMQALLAAGDIYQPKQGVFKRVHVPEGENG